jgi:hypothetical protein
MNARLENAINLAAVLEGRKPAGADAVAYVVEKIQKLARVSHRNAERMCNGELPECPACHGDGWDCKRCRETGYPALARESKAVEAMRETLKGYRLRVYEQGDPRGWPLYLIPEEAGPASEDGAWYNSRGVAVCPS